MRTALRVLIGASTATVMALTGVGVADATPPTVRTASTVTPNSDVVQIVESIADIETSLNSIGLSIEDFAGIEARDPAFLADLRNELDARTTAPTATFQAAAFSTMTVGRKDLQPQWLAYAAAVAQTNAARDPDARDIGSETAYMYLSHYVDLKSGVDPTTLAVDALSNRSDYYSAWITDDDRMVYDSFLRISRYTRMADDLRQAGTALVGLAESGSAVLSDVRQGVSDGAARVRVGVSGANLASSGDALATTVPRTIRLFNNADDPAALIDAVESNIAQETDQALAEAASDIVLTVAFLVAGGAGGFLLPAAIAVLSVDAAMIKDMIDGAAIAGLRYTINGRYSGRMMRYYGW